MKFQDDWMGVERGFILKSYKVIFQPGDLEVEVLAGSTIMEAMDKAGIDADFPCGGRGKCGKCRVKILKGAGEPAAVEQEILVSEELADGIRLACSTKIYSDISVKLPSYKQLQHNILITSGQRAFQVEPHLNKIFVEVEKPSLDAQRSVWRRLKDCLVEYGYNDSDLELPVYLLPPAAGNHARSRALSYCSYVWP